ncbi:DUF802 domain-containing protein [Rhodanobacter sp. MP7CTX1]|uniref:DUF802 domain-containing protein n=1 Tax=Rhodanobacter sp. MP7CTX1 TaxID=2723084 RepID=UPI0016177BAB|nr:DUF802 domain-containing protein [Rhodanobacter sp. MP7CTX1]MBB6186966.1 hypothetical protein [Rhodanobacter sp. MP7CTX1]
MFRNLLNLVVFLVGLAAVCWIGAGYIGSNLLATAVTMLIGVCYLAGGFELYRYRQATFTLTGSVADLSAAPTSLSDWLARLHPSLRNATRLRIEGERAALPVPALTPYLVGLLVLLGMLGTLLGMMATLRGTGLALESATDLQAIRGSLAAPVKGLGFAFGTSIAGVASSAMLGLLSALCRRERLQAVQLLDVKIATTLRIYSQSHQREESFKLLQQQTALMPTLVDRLQTMMATIEQQSMATSERQMASHETFHSKTEAIYTRLASSVEASLKDSVAASAVAVGAALQPAMKATMAGLARETASLHDTVTHAVQRQLEGLSTGLETTTTTMAASWNDALMEHRRSNEILAQDLRSSLQRFTEIFEERSVGLLEGVSAHLDATAGSAANAWNNALSRQEAVNEDLAARNQTALTVAVSTFEEHATSLVRIVHQSHADVQAVLESRDQERLTTWTDSFGAMTAAVSKQWEQAGEHAASQQQEICDILAGTVRDISAQTQAHASDTIAEISRLVEAASEAPKAAAEVVAELRQKLSDSMVRDTAMLEERSRLMATLDTLLDAVNHASTEQRLAVDALVATSADLLDRVSTRFTDHIEAETGKLGAVAAQVTGSAVEVASLGEVFGVAVQAFGESNGLLMDHLQRIEAALDKSLARSDEQLAYYVAQAREVIDLSMLSQKQIIEEMQQLAVQRALDGAEMA